MYPRMMGERYFPAVERTGLGAENAGGSLTDIFSALTSIRPGEIQQEIETARAEVRTATLLMKVLIPLNFVAMGLASYAIIQGLRK